MTRHRQDSAQDEAVRFLADPATHGARDPVETVATHISLIVLTGERAFKMKRAVKLPYADFSTPELRLAACRKEVELNSRTAPGLYLAARRITREADGRIAFDGEGELIDAVVEMKRFDQSCLLDKMAAAGTITPDLARRIAHAVARFHADAPAVHAGAGAANLEAVLDINRAGFAESGFFDARETEALDSALRAALARHAALLDRREAAGKVRRCHGDLHLRNICLLDGEPRLFDCIEFNDRLATVDVLYDLAFLLMDLWHRGLSHLAGLLANRYLDETDNDDGFALLPFLMAVRACVRAHVGATQIAADGDPAGRLAGEARAYFDLATALLRPAPPRMIAIGGLSGSGKTTVADALAPHLGAPPGARVVESDRVRKALYGVPAETRLPQDAYRPEVSRRVYREMAARAERLLAGGGCVVADAVFDRQADRSDIEAVAAACGAPFAGVWLEADASLLRQRVGARTGGPSDATLDVLERQLERGPGDIAWHRLDASLGTGRIVAEILALPMKGSGSPG